MQGKTGFYFADEETDAPKSQITDPTSLKGQNLMTSDPAHF